MRKPKVWKFWGFKERLLSLQAHKDSKLYLLNGTSRKIVMTIKNELNVVNRTVIPTPTLLTDQDAWSIQCFVSCRRNSYKLWRLENKNMKNILTTAKTEKMHPEKRYAKQSIGKKIVLSLNAAVPKRRVCQKAIQKRLNGSSSKKFDRNPCILVKMGFGKTQHSIAIEV